MFGQERTSLWIKIGAIFVLLLIYAGLWWRQTVVDRPQRECLALPGAVWQPKTHSCQLSPQALCEKGGGWWEPQGRSCAKVVSIPELTGRPRR